MRPKWVTTMLLNGTVVATVSGMYAFMPPIGATLWMQGHDMIVRNVAVSINDSKSGGGTVQVTLDLSA